MIANKHLIKPVFTLSATTLGLLLLMLLTSPVNKIAYAVVFFGLLFMALICLGYVVVRVWGAETNARNRYRIVVISLFIIISLMFRSAQSFNWVDALIVVLVAFGLLFYGGRRF